YYINRDVPKVRYILSDCTDYDNLICLLLPSPGLCTSNRPNAAEYSGLYPKIVERVWILF
ncbi:MAG: hypothetical protein WAM88_08785, partial [Nitrososphaeraceae archaeon]